MMVILGTGTWSWTAGANVTDLWPQLKDHDLASQSV
jgi:hypothetical protein